MMTTYDIVIENESYPEWYPEWDNTKWYSKEDMKKAYREGYVRGSDYNSLSEPCMNKKLFGDDDD